MDGNRFVYHFTKILLDIMFYGGAVLCVTLPLLLSTPFLRTYVHPLEMRIPFTVILMTSGACAVYIVYQLKTMFKTLVGGNPFVLQNVSALRKCAVASFLIALIYLIRIVFWFTFGSTIIVIIFALLGLFSLTLKDLFKQAVLYKEDADWTV